jgi:outer membrane protein OmpA-like peptidoglycan-associated protein
MLSISSCSSCPSWLLGVLICSKVSKLARNYLGKLVINILMTLCEISLPRKLFMGKPGNNPIILISVLSVTFILSVAAILWAQQFALNSTGENNSETAIANSSQLINQNNSVATSNPLQTKEIKKGATSKAKPLKIEADLENWPVKGQVTFFIDSANITSEGLETIKRLSEQIAEYDPRSVAVKVSTNLGASPSSQTLGQKRGEQVAGSLRDRVKHKIIIYNNNPNPKEENSSSTPEARNPPVEVSLFNFKN